MEIFFNGKKQVFADVNGHIIKTDQSPRGGGDGEFPEPFTLFLASLGTCAGIYVKSFCDQRGIPAEDIKLTQAQNYNPIKKLIDQIEIQIHVPAIFPEKYESAVINTASLCAVKRHLKDDIEVSVKVVRH
ncbi:MAG TPA: OsmC family protein [Bacteroidales bacterium]|nr:OsmC family protein [Bacteroidales bacterium]HPE57896.1 OsmC family protein [Bacteroidales bacterium]HRX97189.1 OsmC family protein [Bacteroidales bacterium]